MSITGGYTINHGDRYAGMVVDAEVNNSVSKLNKTSSIIPWGIFVARDGDDGFKPVTDTTTAKLIIGATRRELNRAQVDGADAGAPANRTASVLTAGPIYMQTIGAVAAGDPVYAMVGTSGNPAANPGFANNVVGATVTLGVLIPNAKFLETTSAAGIVAVSLVIGG